MKPFKKHFINIGSKIYDAKTTVNFHNKTQKNINENFEKSKNNKKRLIFLS